MSTLYDPDMIEVAIKRGYDPDAHAAALQSEDEDQIGLTHPANWMTEFEVEVCTTLDGLIAEGLVQ